MRNKIDGKKQQQLTHKLLELIDSVLTDIIAERMAKTMRCQGSRDEEKTFKINFMESYILLVGFLNGNAIKTK